jgi:DNA-directed RNA polymerase alpha subunit
MRKLDESTSILAENERLKKENERLASEHAIMKDAYVNVRNKNAELDATLQTYRILHENIELYKGEPLTEEEKHLVAILRTKLEDFHLSARTMSGMKRANIETIGDLISRNKSDLLQIKDFGKKSLTELDDLVDSLDLSFGTDVQKYLLREADSFTII